METTGRIDSVLIIIIMIIENARVKNNSILKNKVPGLHGNSVADINVSEPAIKRH